MGLRDDIQTLEARYDAGQDVAQELACAYAEMCIRKDSKRLVSLWFDELISVLSDANRFHELKRDGVDPRDLGAWDQQKAARDWLAMQGGEK